MLTARPMSWSRSLAQPVTYLGVAMLVLIAAALSYMIGQDRANANAAALRDGDNLVRVFADQVARTVDSADTVLRMLRALHQRAPSGFDLTSWTNDPALRNDLLFQVSIAGADGKVLQSSRGAAGRDIDMSDRQHFQVHVRSTGDELFISKPIQLRGTARWALVLTRRILAPDGSFAGVIAAAIEPSQFERLYNSLDLGRSGTASLAGFDGVIRARGGGRGSYIEALGSSIGKSALYRHLADSPAGAYWSAAGTFDPGPRLISYRVIDGFPLVAVVARSEAEIFGAAAAKARLYDAVAAFLAVAILIAIALGAGRQRALVTTAATLERTNVWFDTALDNMPHGLCMFDPDKRLIVCNRRYGEMYGLAPEQTRRGTPLRSILEARVAAGNAPVDTEAYIAHRLDEVSRPVANYVVNQLRDGRMIAVNHQPMRGGGWVAVHQDISAQKRVEAEIAHMAHHDGLTGLANRLLLIEEIRLAAARAVRSGRTFNLFILDLDRFKAVNDSFGHPTGDMMIKAVADRLRACVGGGDTVARLGGDEFAIVQDGGGNGSGDGAGDARARASELTARVLASLAEPHELDGHQMIVSVSIGIATAPDDGVDADQLLRRADLALYRAKADGRNCCRFFAAELEVEARFRHLMENDLRNAVARGEFELYYQPVIATATRQMRGAEALVRWNHPEHGLLLPGRFIPLAEESGLIIGLGEWILRQACRDAAAWPSHVKVAVNLSSVQFRTGDLGDVVIRALADAGLPPSRLELEITESVLLQKNDANLAMLRKLKELGVAVVLDDFGTGYSSLSYLQMFPFDKIKIDKSFVDELPHRADCGAIICAITGLARSLDIETTAEGVETVEQFELLSAASCTQAQGYLFGRPRPLADLDFCDPLRGGAAA